MNVGRGFALDPNSDPLTEFMKKPYKTGKINKERKKRKRKDGRKVRDGQNSVQEHKSWLRNDHA